MANASDKFGGGVETIRTLPESGTGYLYVQHQHQGTSSDPEELAMDIEFTSNALCTNFFTSGTQVFVSSVEYNGVKILDDPEASQGFGGYIANQSTANSTVSANAMIISTSGSSPPILFKAGDTLKVWTKRDSGSAVRFFRFFAFEA
jgi:hypothetical protein